MAFQLDTDEFIGIPYVDKGRDLTGCDCWGLLRLVYGKLGIDLPHLLEDYQSAADREVVSNLVKGGDSSWQLVDEGSERAGDAILLKISGQLFHVGVVVNPGRMIHALAGVGSLVEDYQSATYGRRVLGFYRHERLST